MTPGDWMTVVVVLGDLVATVGSGLVLCGSTSMNTLPCLVARTAKPSELWNVPRCDRLLFILNWLNKSSIPSTPWRCLTRSRELNEANKVILDRLTYISYNVKVIMKGTGEGGLAPARKNPLNPLPLVTIYMNLW